MADPDKYPWIVYIRVPKKGGAYRCTGALVDDQHVLTAAHCMPKEEQYRPDKVHVYLGNDFWESRNTLTVSQYFVHEYYDFDFEDGIDIAVLRLTHPLKNVNAVCLTSNPSSFVGRKALAAGFGMDENGKHPKKLMMTHVTIISNDQCRDAYMPRFGDIIKR